MGTGVVARTDSKLNNFLLIGFGPHARRIYYPIFERDGVAWNSKIAVAVDLISEKPEIEGYLKEHGTRSLEMIYLHQDDSESENLSDNTTSLLNKLVEKHCVVGVIISTDPIAHMRYAKWALEIGLNILMDKPVSARTGITSSLAAADQIAKDFSNLASKYISSKQRNPRILFSMMAQRRYHPAFIKIKELIQEVFLRTNCPVTSTHSLHSDGQWRFPSEIIEQSYHTYNQGYGKCLHSGYHSLDIIPWLLSGAEKETAVINNADVFTNFIKPNSFLNHITMDDYRNLFANFDEFNHYSSKEFIEETVNYGEIDAFNSVVFKHNDIPITVSSINLLHNGCAQRNWVTAAGRDLYKGNGRVRHETHYITQGPFQVISFESFQSKEMNPEILDGLYDIGGEYHLNINVFRNDKMFPDWESYESFTITDIGVKILEGSSRGHQEDARRSAIEEFVLHATGHKALTMPVSDLLDHNRSAAITSAIYRSEVLRKSAENPLVNIKL